MKNKKIIPIITTFAIVIGSLTGCSGRVTSEKLAEDYMNSIKNIESVTLDTKMDIELSMSQDGTSVDMGIDGNMKSAIVIEDEKNYTSKVKINADVSFLGITQNVGYNTYDVCEDGQITTYTKDLSDNSWSKDYSELEGNPSQLDAISEYINTFKLNKDTEYIGNLECYVLNGTLTGNDKFNDTLEDMDIELDADDMMINSKLYMDKKTHQPVRIEMIADESLIGKKFNTEDYDVTIKNFSYIIDISKINNTSEIKIPSEAYDAWDHIFIETEKAPSETEVSIIEEETETQSTELESFDTSDIEPISGEGLNTLEYDNLSFRVYESPLSYGGTEIYILGINQNSSDRSVYVELDYYKDGIKIDDDARYLNLQSGCYDIESLYIEEDYDDIKFKLTNETVYEDYTGNEIDVDYNLSADKFFGTITNNTNETISYPIVKIVVWGENRSVAYYEYTYADDTSLAPGETSNFDAYIDYDARYSDFNVYVTGTVE